MPSEESRNLGKTFWAGPVVFFTRVAFSPQHEMSGGKLHLSLELHVGMQVMFFNYVCLDPRGLSATTPTCLAYLGDPSAVAAAATDSVTCGVLFSGTWFVL